MRQMTDKTLIKNLGVEAERLANLAKQAGGLATKVKADYPNRYGDIASDKWEDVSDHIAAFVLLLSGTRESAISAQTETLHAKTELVDSEAE